MKLNWLLTIQKKVSCSYILGIVIRPLLIKLYVVNMRSYILLSIISRVYYQEEYVAAWVSKLYTAKWWHHPTCTSLTIAMHNPCFVYTVIIHMAVWLQVCCMVSDQNYSTKGLPCSIIHRLVATQFWQIHVLVQHLSGIYYML